MASSHICWKEAVANRRLWKPETKLLLMTNTKESMGRDGTRWDGTQLFIISSSMTTPISVQEITTKHSSKYINQSQIQHLIKLQ